MNAEQLSQEQEPRLATLVAYDCWSLLGQAEIARVGWQSAAGVAIVPVNYVVADGAVWFRTDPSSALAREAGGTRIVVEVDHVDPRAHAGWSVVVSGTAQLVEFLDVPDMLVDMRIWPGGNHALFVRVDPDEVTGRRLSAAPDDRP